MTIQSPFPGHGGRLLPLLRWRSVAHILEAGSTP